jgi:hypothetical protein
MYRFLFLVILGTCCFSSHAQQDSTSTNYDNSFVTPDGDIILPEVSIETVQLDEKRTWKTLYFYELAEHEGRYKIKDGTRLEIKRTIELDGKANTLRVYGNKNSLKMHHDVRDIIRSEHQLTLNFTNGAYMIIDNQNHTISLFEANFGFVYKMKE